MSSRKKVGRLIPVMCSFSQSTLFCSRRAPQNRVQVRHRAHHRRVRALAVPIVTHPVQIPSRVVRRSKNPPEEVALAQTTIRMQRHRQLQLSQRQHRKNNLHVVFPTPNHKIKRNKWKNCPLLQPTKVRSQHTNHGGTVVSSREEWEHFEEIFVLIEKVKQLRQPVKHNTNGRDRIFIRATTTFHHPKIRLPQSVHRMSRRKSQHPQTNPKRMQINPHRP